MNGRNPSARWLRLGGAVLSVVACTVLLFAPLMGFPGEDSGRPVVVLWGSLFALSLFAFPLVYGLSPFFAYRWTASEGGLAYSHLAPKRGSVSRRLENAGFTSLRRTWWCTVVSRSGRGDVRLPRYLEDERGRGRLEFVLDGDRLVLAKVRAQV
ncbi:hypothetical protein WA016_01422 [Myxococcus stipitatus]